MATNAQTDVIECSNCGGEMELRETMTRKTIPLVGSEVEVGEFICKDCGVGRRLERDDPSDTWS